MLLIIKIKWRLIMDLEEILLIIALIVGASIDVFIVLKLCSKYRKNKNNKK